jgi:hypothetical protein
MSDNNEKQEQSQETKLSKYSKLGKSLVETARGKHEKNVRDRCVVGLALLDAKVKALENGEFTVDGFGNICMDNERLDMFDIHDKTNWIAE